MDRRHIGILLPVAILTYGSHRHVILHQPAKFRSNPTIGGAEIWRYIDFSRWRPQSRKSIFGLRFRDGTRLRRCGVVCRKSVHSERWWTAFWSSDGAYWTSTASSDPDQCCRHTMFTQYHHGWHGTTKHWVYCDQSLWNDSAMWSRQPWS